MKKIALDIPKILIVDDELNICEACVRSLSKMNYDVQYALNGYDALKMMEEYPFELVITDLKMHRLGGMEVLHRIKEAHPDTMVIVITGYATVASAVEAMKIGAFDYLPKPFTPQEIRAVVLHAFTQKEIMLQNRKLMNKNEQKKTFAHQLIGTSSGISKVIKMVQKVAPTDSTVLVYGESGTGKELIARAVYANSERKDKVFFAVDCGTLSSSLLESELFGHVKGSFTGAHKDKDGIFKLADGGTVFLDEISNISLNVQVKLLRFLETRDFFPRGSSKRQKVNVRLIFATNKNLEKMVANGSFREDLYYRIFVYPIIIPPLRERKNDILPIAYHFLRQFSKNMEKNITGIDDNVLNRLKEYEWPGNIRQLKNVIERGVILCEKNRLAIKDFPLLSGISDIERLFENIPETNSELKKIKTEIRQKAVNKVEKNFILNALAASNWNVTRASKKVGVQRSNFHSMMKKQNIKLQKNSEPSICHSIKEPK